MGGRAEAHLGPSSRGVLAHARVRRRAGGQRDAPRPGVTRPDTPPPRSLWARVGSLARRPQGPDWRCARSTPGRAGGVKGPRSCARSHPSGEGEAWGLRHLVSLSLPASSGACSPPPSRRGGGRAPSWSPPSALSSPPGPQLGPPPCSHRFWPRHGGAISELRKKKTPLPATSPPPPLLPRPHQNGRRRLGRHRHYRHHHHHHQGSLSLPPERPVFSRYTVTGGRRGG